MSFSSGVSKGPGPAENFPNPPIPEHEKSHKRPLEEKKEPVLPQIPSDKPRELIKVIHHLTGKKPEEIPTKAIPEVAKEALVQEPSLKKQRLEEPPQQPAIAAPEAQKPLPKVEPEPVKKQLTIKKKEIVNLKQNQNVEELTLEEVTESNLNETAQLKNLTALSMSLAENQIPNVKLAKNLFNIKLPQKLIFQTPRLTDERTMQFVPWLAALQNFNSLAKLSIVTPSEQAKEEPGNIQCLFIVLLALKKSGKLPKLTDFHFFHANGIPDKEIDKRFTPEALLHPANEILQNIAPLTKKSPLAGLIKVAAFFSLIPAKFKSLYDALSDKSFHLTADQVQKSLQQVIADLKKKQLAIKFSSQP